jgi:diacylglycerol diphosphate phosphatase/phosphatidate phosphatase
MSPPSRSPSGGLAARTGWIGSIARFWQVCLNDSLRSTSYPLTKPRQKTYAPDYVGFVLLLTAYLLVRLLLKQIEEPP